MFIKKVILENFQSHENSVFEFDSRLNVIIGVSNVGKSSVARALSLLLFNQWDKSWCKFGAKYCRVTALTNTGIEVIREKGEKVNRYILRLPGQAEQLFESFGTTVPEQIQQALRIHTVQVDTTDTLNLNLAGQMDALFLLSQAGSYRAKVLGKLSGATYLDHAIRELNKDKRQLTAEKNNKDLEIIDLQSQVDKIANIEAYSTVLAELQAKLTSLAAAEQRVERIRSLFKSVKDLKDAWVQENQKAALLESFESNSITALETRVDKIKALCLLQSTIVRLKRSYEHESKLQDLLKTVDLSVIPILVDKSTSLKTIRNLSSRINKNNTELVDKTNKLQQVKQQHAQAAQQYTDMLRANGKCPTCGGSTADLCVQ
ncbi:MAG: AAA family ATPase [bacterium]